MVTKKEQTKSDSSPENNSQDEYETINRFLRMYESVDESDQSSGSESVVLPTPQMIMNASIESPESDRLVNTSMETNYSEGSLLNLEEPSSSPPLQEYSSDQPPGNSNTQNLRTDKYPIKRLSRVIDCDLSRISRRKGKRRISPTVHDLGLIPIEKFTYVGAGNAGTFINASTGKRITMYESTQQLESVNQLTDAIELVKNERNHEVDDSCNTFFVGRQLTPLHISQAVEFFDFKSRELYDLLQKKTKLGLTTTNYVELIDSKLVCFRSKKILQTELKENQLKFDCPVSRIHCYPEKYTLDLRGCRVYLVTGTMPYEMSLLCCCKLKISQRNLCDVSDTEIQRIDTTANRFSVILNKDDHSELVEVKHLDFVVYCSGEYYWFRCNNANSFLKWIVAIQVRRGAGG